MKKRPLLARAFLLALTVGIGSALAGDGPPPDRGKPGGSEHGNGEPGKHEPGKHELGKPEMGAAGTVILPAKEQGDAKPPGERGAGEGPGRGMRGQGMRELAEQLKAGKLKKADVKDRLKELREHREDRAKEHREELKARFGAALSMPAAREELEHHARRSAKLDRALLLCETEVVKDKDKLKERIQKLIDRENDRHAKAMQRLQSMPAAPGSPAAAAVPVSPAASVAVERAGAK